VVLDDTGHWNLQNNGETNIGKMTVETVVQVHCFDKVMIIWGCWFSTEILLFDLFILSFPLVCVCRPWMTCLTLKL
jgi:hypothetical protein